MSEPKRLRFAASARYRTFWGVDFRPRWVRWLWDRGLLWDAQIALRLFTWSLCYVEVPGVMVTVAAGPLLICFLHPDNVPSEIVR